MASDTTYNGRKTDSRPKPISWKKNPSRHIARERFQSGIKSFGSYDPIFQSFHSLTNPKWNPFFLCFLFVHLI
jgi:hypothetical protein